jgi:Tfp pilus assembly protein PilN
MADTIEIKKLTSLAAGSGEKLRQAGASLLRMLTFNASDDLIFPQKNVSVSIEKGGLSIAYGSRFLSRIVVRKAKEAFFETDRYPNPDEVAASLAVAVNEFGAPRSNLTLSIPKAWTIIKTAEFPSTVKENLADVVSYELDRLIPFAAEDAFFDFRLLSENNGRITILIMAAKEDMLRPYLASFAESGFTIGRVTVNLLGFGTLCRQMKGGSDTIFVKINAKDYEGACFAGNSVSHIFSGPLASSEANARADVIASEVRSLIGAAKVQGRSPNVTMCMKDNNPTLGEMLKMRIPVPLAIMKMADTGIRFRGEIPKGTPFASLGALVESLQTRPRGPNLLTKGVYREQKPPVTVTFILLAAIIVTWAVYLMAPLRVEEKRLAALTRQISSKRDEVRKVEALKKEADALNAEVAAVKSFKEDRPLDLNILRDLTTVLPKTTWLTRVRITETGVDIEGYATAATELLPKLEASKYFRKVEFASPTFRDVRMNADRFVIRMEIEGAKKIEDTFAKPAPGQKMTETKGPKSEKK